MTVWHWSSLHNTRILHLKQLNVIQWSVYYTVHLIKCCCLLEVFNNMQMHCIRVWKAIFVLRQQCLKLSIRKQEHLRWIFKYCKTVSRMNPHVNNSQAVSEWAKNVYNTNTICQTTSGILSLSFCLICLIQTSCLHMWKNRVKHYCMFKAIIMIIALSYVQGKLKQ